MKFDLYGREPLYFATWFGFFWTILTYLAVLYFAYLQAVDVMPLAMEGPTEPTVKFEIVKAGNTLEFDETFATWVA